MRLPCIGQLDRKVQKTIFCQGIFNDLPTEQLRARYRAVTSDRQSVEDLFSVLKFLPSDLYKL